MYYFKEDENGIVDAIYEPTNPEEFEKENPGYRTMNKMPEIPDYKPGYKLVRYFKNNKMYYEYEVDEYYGKEV